MNDANRYLIATFYAAVLLVLSGCLATPSPTIQRSSGETVPIRLEVKLYSETVSAPTVIIGHGSGGISVMHRDMASTLNSWGYNAVVVDHYTLRGIAAPHTGVAVHGARGEDRALDFIETGRWVQQQSWHQGKIAVVGFSQGGGGVLALVNDRILRNLNYISDSHPNPIAAAAAFYPSCAITSPPRQPSMPTQIHLAEKDDLAFISACGFGANTPFEIHLYKEATHSFDESFHVNVRLRFTHRFDPAVTRQSRQHLRQFLDTHLR